MKKAVVSLLCAMAIAAVGVVGIRPALAAPIPCPASAPPGTVLDGNVTVSAGSPCTLVRAKILGSLLVGPGASADLTRSDVAFRVTVADGGSLRLQNSKVGSRVVATNSASVELLSVGLGDTVRAEGSTGNVRICDSVTPGWVIVSGSTSPDATIVIGDTRASGCGGNNVGGKILVSDNAAPSSIQRNTASGIRVLDNTSTTASVIARNTADSIECSGNAVAPTGQNNTAPVMTGQCADL